MPAQKDLWILGDTFVNDNFHALPALNRQTKIDTKAALFIYQQFNVRCFNANPTSQVKTTTARIANCLIKALNDKNVDDKEGNKLVEQSFNHFLPRIIVVVPDWDIIKFLDHDDYSVDEVFGNAIRWMIDAMIEAVDDKKRQMKLLRPGSLMPGEPKFIWVKVIRRLGAYDKAMSVRNRFKSWKASWRLKSIIISSTQRINSTAHPFSLKTTN